MISRFRRYILNVGPLPLVLNMSLLAYLIWIQIRMALSGPEGLLLSLVITLPSAVFGLLGPRLVRGWLLRHAGTILRMTRIMTRLILFALVGIFLAKVNVPGWVFVLLLPFVFLTHGLTFWIISDPLLYTERGYNAELEGIMQMVNQRAAEHEAQRAD